MNELGSRANARVSDEPSFTPGPWFAGKPYGDGPAPQVIGIGPFDADEHYEDTICEVWDGNHVATANAALISAAPEMFHALDLVEQMLILSRIAIRTRDKAQAKAANREVNAWLDKVRAALAKAQAHQSPAEGGLNQTSGEEA